MIRTRNVFVSEASKQAYVRHMEEDFEGRLSAAVHTVAAQDDCRLITLSGPTCSGKTTTAAKLTAALRERGRRVHLISIDDYYFDRLFLQQRAEQRGTAVDFESEDTIDLPLLSRTVEGIAEGGEVQVPIYDFSAGARSGFRTLRADRDDVFLFEGIQAVYPGVTALFDGHPYQSIFVCIAQGIEIGGGDFPPHTIRLMRRLVRDSRFRAAPPDFTMRIWRTVRENEEANIFPYASRCDVHIDSLLPYEIGMLKPAVLPLLSTLLHGEYHDFAVNMEQRLSGVCAISSAYLPEGAMYHEFLG